MHDDTWTVESLTELLASNGYSRYLLRRGPLFGTARPLPQAGRPGEPLHPQTDCLVWLKAPAFGYGTISVGPATRRRKRPVHRIAFELAYGPVPAGLVVAHLCERRSCGRPNHVRPATTQQNIREGACRKYPDWLLGMAPESTCARCGLPRTPGILYLKNPKPNQPLRWTLTCLPCGRLMARDGWSRSRARITPQMSPDAVAAFWMFQRGERPPS